MIWLIEISIILVTAILVIHARAVYNQSFVKVFWISGMIMGFLREYALNDIMKIYDYGDFHITLFGLPLIYTLFWTDIAYIGLTWSNNFLEREYLKAKPLDYHLPLIFLTMVLISFFFEALLSQYGLHIWKLDSSAKLWGNTPILAPFAYGWTVVLFIKSLKLLSKEPQQNWRVLVLKLSLAQPLVVLILAGLLLLSNLAIILVFS
ncbi:MAG: hypothetical protein HN995_08015 [Candidatus Marinimicrobia bacterium]|jgi:hypothetical protein|nr:hypothetical protein [Candidatus Neomarinimicrobiota bacterium]MBT3574806.1 hypothetical protein [Candidatus Neomarinimicrobiota bacterium]MBT3681192.1 hypothetical protein [Candidatus Neomarinimicrobiota bacterium]MBT3950185.1 hypothetical protein [Candidatus Neomarinimicrobiota bacterium]MBT4254085.1 hypothetical protein [Candidatus Neomarinimicrobiota bacterium]